MGNIKEKVNIDVGFITERITDVILYGCLSFPTDCMTTTLKGMTLPLNIAANTVTYQF